MDQFNNHYNEKIKDTRDFIGRARNTMATLKLSIENLKESLNNPNFGNIENFDEDFTKPIELTTNERIDKMEVLTQQMLHYINLFDEFDKQNKDIIEHNYSIDQNFER